MTLFTSRTSSTRASIRDQRVSESPDSIDGIAKAGVDRKKQEVEAEAAEQKKKEAEAAAAAQKKAWNNNAKEAFTMRWWGKGVITIELAI